MAIDRAGARRRVKTITAWAAGGAAALTAAFAFGASRGNHVAKATAAAPVPNGTSQDGTPQSPDPGASLQDPQNGYPQDNQGFTPPSSSAAPPSGMSGGS
jgi:hypothetical protein